jgi:hypothetical protein
LHVSKGGAPLDQLRQGKGIVRQAHVENGQQHQQRPGHGVEKELDRGIDAARATPNADEKIHGHQREFPEDVEEEQVLGQKDAEHACF